MNNMNLSVGTYVKTKNGKSGKIRNMYSLSDSKILVILLKDNSCYVCTHLELI